MASIRAAVARPHQLTRASCLFLLVAIEEVWLPHASDLPMEAEAPLEHMDDAKEVSAPNDSCHESGIMYVPLDMRGTRVKAGFNNSVECQARCVKTENCTHFVYYKDLKTCHVQDANSQPVQAANAFVAGPRVCQGRPCFEMTTSYSPHMKPVGFYGRFSKDEAIRRCQELCHAVDGCKHFVLLVSQKQKCHLADANSRRYYPVMGTLSGPPRCPDIPAEGIQSKFDKSPRPRGAGVHSFAYVAFTVGAFSAIGLTYRVSGLFCGGQKLRSSRFLSMRPIGDADASSGSSESEDAVA
eukprot:CAMPEP_0197897422 /NCGR_PEP_ID=MMETSP1439-20131203/42174_1 /TAXON_ID=66791 /ORGANISM="Gonyaulax spinifera, Strain CCMP409" /LENGTH=296 /DNA_ID=CAMNT_0043518053 /DNA_START=73 /DNA_END=963 /DNA_ORIENTATION=-